MNVLLQRTWSAVPTCTRISTHPQVSVGMIHNSSTYGSMQKRYASWSANQRRPKTNKKVVSTKKKVSEKYLIFNRSRPQGRMPDFRPPQELLTDYLPDDATIRLGIARVHMANRKPLYESDLNKEVNVLLSTPVRKVQLMGDLRKVSEANINELALPDWLKSGLIGLAKATPSNSNEANKNPQ